jgi:protein-tyrosine phosphatase
MPVAWDAVRRLVFICRGNICRSAFGAAVARSLGVSAMSFGLDTRRGGPADPGMREAARRFGHDLGGHRTAPIDDYAPLEGDLLLVFEMAQLRQLQLLRPEAIIRPLGRWARPPRAYIHDPYANSRAFYSRTCRIIETATRSLVDELRRARCTGTES